MRFRRYRREDTGHAVEHDVPANRPGYNLTRALFTLVGAAAAGLLVWLSTQVNDHTTGGYWAVYGLIAAAGLAMALSQLLGGWTKWGWPRVSAPVFLLAFVPTLIVAGWVIAAGQPHGNWLHDHVVNWSGDIHVRGLVNDLKEYIPVLAFGIGLVFGLSCDTSGPRTRRVVDRDRRRDVVMDRRAADEPTTAERTTAPTTTRTGDGELAATRTGTGNATPVAPQPDTPTRVDDTP
jgi:hypothetical protein